MIALQVFVGAGLGGLLRYFAGLGCGQIVGVVVSNLVGTCFLLFLIEDFQQSDFNFLGFKFSREILTIGFCGGLTTYSSFLSGFFRYFQNEEYARGFAVFSLHTIVIPVLCFTFIYWFKARTQ